MRETERERSLREATSQPQSRTSSTSSQQSQPDSNITKQVGITVYVRRRSHLDINSKDPIKRGEIRRAILKGEAKFTWKTPKAERPSLITAFTKNRIDMSEIEYRRVENATFDKINSVCTGIYGSQE